MAGPTLRRPATVVGDAAAENWAFGEGDGRDAIGGDWWRAFGDPTLDGLVARALANNTDALQAASAVVEARGLLTAASGRRLPRVSLGFDAGRQRFGTGGLGGGIPIGLDTGVSNPTPEVAGGALGEFGGLGGGPTNNFGLDVGVSWQADLFGRLRRGEQAATARLLAARADQLAVRHTVIAEVVRARVALATLNLRRRLAADNVDSLGRTLDLVEALYDAGAGRVSALDVRLARQNVAGAKSQLPPLDRQLTEARLALDVLLGERPGAGAGHSAGSLDLSALPALGSVPLGLPAGLLDRRPDLLAAEFRALAGQAEIGAEVADLFPDLTLGASAGYGARELNDLLDWPARVYGVTANVAQLLFDGGAQVGEITAARGRGQRLAYDYAGRVLVALREVEGALVAEARGREELAAAGASLAEAEAAEALARDRYERGVEPLLSVFEAERRRRQAEEQVALVRRAVWEARIDLHLALGGDWQLPGGGEVDEREVLRGPMAEPGWPNLRPTWRLDVPGAAALDNWPEDPRPPQPDAADGEARP